MIWPNRETDTQKLHDSEYMRLGDSCSGCDNWRQHNSKVGDCTASQIVGGVARWAMVGIENCSIPLEDDAGHVVTHNTHKCALFTDQFNWQSLPPKYLSDIGFPGNTKHAKHKKTASELTGRLHN